MKRKTPKMVKRTLRTKSGREYEVEAIAGQNLFVHRPLHCYVDWVISHDGTGFGVGAAGTFSTKRAAVSRMRALERRFDWSRIRSARPTKAWREAREVIAQVCGALI